MASKFFDLCCICNNGFTKGQHKLVCSKCNSPAHRTCLPRMSNEEFVRCKSTWKCIQIRCKGSNGNESSEESSLSDDERASTLSYRVSIDNSKDLNATLNRMLSLSVDEKCPSSSSSVLHKQNLPGRYKFAHLNINGIKGKFPKICEILSKNMDICVLAITESKLNIKTDKNSYVIPSFHVERIDRSYGELGGSQLIYISRSCTYNKINLPETPPGLVECNILKVSRRGMPTTLLCVIYVPPRDVRNTFFPFFATICQFLTSTKNRVVIMGDFNINLLEESSYKTRLEKVMTEYELVQLVKEPTREKALLDHIYVRREHKDDAFYEVITKATTSDHDMTTVSFH